MDEFGREEGTSQEQPSSIEHSRFSFTRSVGCFMLVAAGYGAHISSGEHDLNRATLLSVAAMGSFVVGTYLVHTNYTLRQYAQDAKVMITEFPRDAWYYLWHS